MKIQLIPSISIIDGQCVRLSQGDYKKQVAYPESPLEIAKSFEDHGIKQVHVIDLEGTKSGHVVNYDTLGLLSAHTELAIDFGGGINTDGDMNKVFEYGARRVTVGSLAIKNRDLFSSWLISYGPNKLTMSADALEGNIMIRGWQKETDTNLIDHIGFYYERGMNSVKCSDVARDGTMQGPSIKMYKNILEKYPDINLYASGGIGSIDDIKALQNIGVCGVIFGKSFYEGKITLQMIDNFMIKN